jgi:sugar lactone lactonase YvrE
MKSFLWLILVPFLTSSASGQASEFYVVDIGPNREEPWQVLKYDENGQNPEVFIDTELSKPQDIVFMEDEGTVLVSNLRSGRITRYNSETGTYINNFASGIGQPTRMKVGSDNLLYVLQWGGNGRVWRYDLAGNFIDEFTSVGVSQSIGMDWDSQGNLYVASFDARHVRKFDSNGNDLGLFVTSNLLGPTNIWFDSSGDLLVTDWSGRAIRRFDSSGTFESNFVLGLNEPEGVDFLSNGDFLVGNGGTSSVRQYDENGNYVKDFIPSGLGGLVKPNAVRIRKLSNFEINPGLNDAWYNPATSGQGFLVSVFPEIQQLFLAWFTFDIERPPEDVTAMLGDPGHRWLTAQGPYDGDTANLTIFVTEGGVFDSAEPPTSTDPAGDGTMTLEFLGCTEGLVNYEITSLGISGEIPIQRIVQDNVPLCEALTDP